MAFRVTLYCVGIIAVFRLAPLASAASFGQLTTNRFIQVIQSSDASANNVASKALDGSSTTFSLTADVAGSFWKAEMGRAFTVSRVELVNRLAPADVEMAGLTMRLYNIEDQLAFQTNVTNPGSGGTWAVNLPTGLVARTLWVGLPGSQTNGGGNRRVGLAEARVFGDLAIPFGPDPFTSPTNTFSVRQSTDYSSSYPAANAIDGDPLTFSHTLNFSDSYWMTDVGSPGTELEFAL